jgi:hypothetical protein
MGGKKCNSETLASSTVRMGSKLHTPNENDKK